ncbi:tetratricopeptide repeat protein [Salinimicrobium soli]|uniref:tetratricopeptide repeat protein n=1 Tax=Salinimicrobium soli TaxID=1254399 RepID=UPI003AB07BD3
MNKKIFILLFLVVTKAGAQTSALAIADSLYAVGNYSEAIEELRSVDNRSEAAKLRLAKSYEALGQFSEALKQYRQVLQKYPERVLTAIDYAETLKKTGKLKQADSIFEALSNQFPQNANFQYQRGLIKEQQQDSTALGYFLNTIKLDEGHRIANYKVAKDLLAERKFAQARLLSLKALSFNPNDAPLTSILAQAYYHQDMFAEAIEQYEKLISLGEESKFIHTKLGYAYFQSQDLKKAIEHYTAALTYNKNDADLHYRLGQLYARAGEYKNSEGHLLTAILLMDRPLDDEYFSLGLTYKLQEQPKSALKYFNRAIEEDPDNELAWYERAIAADNFFKDFGTRQQYYKDYLERYEKSGNDGLVLLARRRLSDLIKEQHLE